MLIKADCLGILFVYGEFLNVISFNTVLKQLLSKTFSPELPVQSFPRPLITAGAAVEFSPEPERSFFPSVYPLILPSAIQNDSESHLFPVIYGISSPLFRTVAKTSMPHASIAGTVLSGKLQYCGLHFLHFLQGPLPKPITL